MSDRLQECPCLPHLDNPVQFGGQIFTELQFCRQSCSDSCFGEGEHTGTNHVEFYFF
jgi:hypothetical protein